MDACYKTLIKKILIRGTYLGKGFSTIDDSHINQIM